MNVVCFGYKRTVIREMKKFKLPPCSIRQRIIRMYGKENACVYDDTMIWDNCDAVCKIAANCQECGHPRIAMTDPCAGRNMLCLNPDCGMDK